MAMKESVQLLKQEEEGLLIEEKLDFIWDTPNGILVTAINDDLAKAMKDSGCYKINLSIESGDEYLDILGQLASEGQWCKSPETVDNDNKTGILYLEQNGYSEWIKNAEEVDFVRMVGVLQLLYDTCSALKEEQEEED